MDMDCTQNFETELISFLKKIDKKYYVTFFSTFFWGFLAHGVAFFNKFAIHDDISALFGVGTTYSLGRWLLGILGRTVTVLLQHHYSLPLLNGVLSLTFIGLSCVLIVKLFGFQHYLSCIAVTGIFTTIPCMTSLFGYMFTAPYYMFGVLMAVGGGYLICSRKNVWLGIVIAGCSAGIYQAYLPLYCSILLFSLITEVIRKKMSNAEFWKKTISAGLEALGSLIVYLVLTKVSLILTNTELQGQRGIDSVGHVPVTEYLKRVLTAYHQFFVPSGYKSAFIYPFNTIYLYWAVLILIALLCFRILRERKINKLHFLLLVSLLPAAVNLIYIMCDYYAVYSLTIYGHVMIFVFLVLLMERTAFGSQINKMLFRCSMGVLLLISMIFCRFDNACYLKAQLVQSGTISYYTALIARIKSTPGYRDEYPVAYIDEFNVNDESLSYVWEFSPLNMSPYWGYIRAVNDYSKEGFMKYWCGYSPKTVDPEKFTNMEEVRNMPAYPDEGSIKVIDETVVVKFGE